ncbi:hypothetical protein ACM16X_02645 [Haloarcula japonica]
MSEDKVDHSLVLNLTQQHEFTNNFFLGKYVDQEKKYKNGETRKVVHCYPIDVKEEEESKRIERLTVHPDHLIPFGQGEISPRKIYVALPDNFTELPNEVKQNTAKDDVTSLGTFFAKFFYKQQTVMRGLEEVARSEPEVMEKIKFATRNTELDDQVREQIMDWLGAAVEAQVNQEDSNSDDDGGS